MAGFSYTGTSITFAPAGGAVSAAINFEGFADGFGPVHGTLVCTPAGAASGTWQWTGVNYPESGDGISGQGTGEWTRVDGRHWSLSGTITASSGDTITVDGQLDLAARAMTGTLT